MLDLTPLEASTLELRSVSSLLGERFFVPAYQRGYRWTPREVTALLKDLAEFRASTRAPEDWYCLQPVVVLRRGNAWEVVDGQQRLTTMHLLMTALRDLGTLLGRGRYRMTYATRDGSAAFLDDPSEDKAGDSIDHHHIWAAYQTIRDWLNDKDGGIRLDLFRCVTDPDGQGPNVRLIWYHLAPQDPVPVFVRLNVGRIPLTSAELIRARLLRRDAGRTLAERLQLSQEWDRAEQRLREPEFWSFVQEVDGAPPARIEVLFDLWVRARPTPPAVEPGSDPLATWLNVEALPAGDKEGVWKGVRSTLDRLEDWFENAELLHLVGFLVATAPAARGATSELVTLLADREGQSASEYSRRLRWRAWRRLRKLPAPKPTDIRPTLSPEELDAAVVELVRGLSYGSDRARLRSALLLFNIAGLLEKGGQEHRFPFGRYKRENWDLEHVRSVAEYVPRSPAARRRWLEAARGFLDSPAAQLQDASATARLAAEADAQLARAAPDPEAFEGLFSGIRALSGEEETRSGEAVAWRGDDALSNLCLLDTATNRAYQNAIFPVKRRWVIDLDRQGRFVPPATRDLFLKYHNPDATQLWVWSADDQRAYERALQRTLRAFFDPLSVLAEAK